MFARVSTFKMKPEKIADAENQLNKMMPQIMSLPGMKSFTNVINEDGSGVVMSVVESEEISNANQERVAQIWDVFSDHLAEPPVVNGYRVMVHSSN